MRNIKDKLKELKVQAAGIWPEVAGRYQFKKAHIIVGKDLDNAMAVCWQASNTIELNSNYLLSDYKRMLNEVIGHELCHIITPLIYPGIGFTEEDAHGKEWQEVMNKMGIVIDPIDLL